MKTTMMKIKNISWGLLFALISPFHAQITIEHVYNIISTNYNYNDPDTFEYWPSFSPGLVNPLINLSNGGYKYVRTYSVRDNNTNLYNNYQLKFYDLNHSLWKTIDIAPVINNLSTTTYTNMIGVPPSNLLYISDKLFDNDNDIEFIIHLVGFYLFDETTMNISNIAGLNPDSIIPASTLFYYSYNPTVYNTPNGAKLILNYNGTKDYVLSLPGTYPPQPVIVKENNIGIEQANPFPNPANKQITLPYSLPAHKTGELIIYDMQGKEIKKFKIDNAFNNILLNTSELNNGMYIYKVQCDGEVILTKKFVISN